MPKLRYPGDIPITDALPHADASKVMLEMAAILTATGRGSSHGVYVHKWGRGWAVALTDRFARLAATSAANNPG